MSSLDLFGDDLATTPAQIPLSDRPRPTTIGHAQPTVDPLDGCTVIDCWVDADGIPYLTRKSGSRPAKFAFWDNYELFDRGMGDLVIRHKVLTTHVYTALGAKSYAGGRILE